MAGEGDKHIAPDTARYYPVDFKKVIPIVLAVMLFGLLLLVFFTGSDSEDRQQVLEEAEPVAPVRTTSTDEFDQQLGRRLSESETNRLEQESPVPKPRATLPNYRDRRDAVAQALRGRQQSSGGSSSVLAEFRAKELERALNSGINGFGSDGQTIPSSVSIPSGAGSAPSRFSSSLSPRTQQAQANSEQANDRLAEAIQNLQNVQNQANSSQTQSGATPGAPNLNGGGFGGAFATPVTVQSATATSRSSGTSNSSQNTGTPDNPAFPSGFAGSNATFLAIPPAGTKTILAGTVVPIVLETKVISDYPGQVKARILRDVYSHDNAAVLIPAGSVVLANSAQLNTDSNQAINNRVAIAAPTIIRPDGLKIDLRNQTILDAAGVGGVKDRTNYHILTQTLAAVAFVGVTALGTSQFVDILGIDDDDPLDELEADDSGEPVIVQPTVQVVTTTDTTTVTTVDADGNETTTTTTSTDEEAIVLQPTVSQPNVGSPSVTTFDTSGNIEAQIAGQFGVQLQQAFQPIISRFFNLEPTITLRPGTRMSLILESDVYAAPWSHLYDEFN